MPYRVSLPPERRVDASVHSPAASPIPENPVTPVAAGNTTRPILAKRRPRPRRTMYGYPWPDAISGLGDRRVRSFDLCTDCHRGTWIVYGDKPLCLACAQEKTQGTS